MYPIIMYVFSFVLPQQSPLFKMSTLVIVTVPLNFLSHHAPALSFMVWIHVNSPLPQWALKFCVLMTFQGFIRPSCHLELMVIHSSLNPTGSGTTVAPDEVWTTLTVSASSTISSSTIAFVPFGTCAHWYLPEFGIIKLNEILRTLSVGYRQ